MRWRRRSPEARARSPEADQASPSWPSQASHSVPVEAAPGKDWRPERGSPRRGLSERSRGQHRREVTTERRAPRRRRCPCRSRPSTASTTSSRAARHGVGSIVGIALAAALLVGFVLWRRHKEPSGGLGRRHGAAQPAHPRRTGRRPREGVGRDRAIEALASEARSLEGRAPDDPSRAAAARVRARLDELAATLETDRRLRLGSPPPSAEQLAYSTEVIRQQTAELQSVLLPPNSR